MTGLLYTTVVLVWGVSWIALHYQLGVVPEAVSIFYRFALAAALMFGFLKFSGRLRPLTREQHLICAGQGATLYCFNFLCMYIAGNHVTSGLLAVIFSTAVLWNAFLSWLLMSAPLRPAVIAGGVIGIAGLALLFGPDIFEADNNVLLGVAWALTGTLSFSLGNMLALRHNASNADLVSSVAWGMVYGACVLLAVALLTGQHFTFDPSPEYVVSLAFLTIAASIVAFLSYLGLVRRIGADKAAYSAVVFPIIALNISAAVEGYQWTLWGLAGLTLVAAGNVLAFRGEGRKRRAMQHG